MDIKERVIAEVLAHRDAGVIRTENDYGLDSLAKLEVVSFLEAEKPSFLDNCFDAVAEAVSLNEIMAIFARYQVAQAA